MAALRSAREQRGVGAVGDQDADLAAGERRRAVLDDAEGRRRRQVGDRRPHRRRRVRVGGEAETVGDTSGEVLVDVAQVGDHAGADAGLLALAQLEHERVDDVLLLDRCLAHVELASLAEVVGEALRADPLLRALDGLREARVPADRVLARAGGVAASTSSARS